MLTWHGQQRALGTFPLSMLHSFNRQQMLVALHKVQATCISRQAIVIGEGSFKLRVVWGLPPLSLVDVLQVTSGGFGT